MLFRSDKAKNELMQTENELTGELAIGCNESQSMNELSEIICSFRKKYPLVKFSLRSGNNNDIREWIDNGIIDFGILVEPVETERYTYLRLHHKDQWGILIHKNAGLSSNNFIHAKDLVGVPLITISDETIHNELSSWSGKYADKMIPIVHYNLLANAATLVRKQEGVAICSKPNCNYEDLKFIPFEPELKLGTLLAWKNNQTFSKAGTAFIRLIKEQ